MTSPASPFQFVAQPISPPSAQELEPALAASQKLLETIVAPTPDLDAFHAAEQAYDSSLTELGTRHTFAYIAQGPDFAALLWRMNLTAHNLVAAGVTADGIRQQLGAIPSNASLLERLALPMCTESSVDVRTAVSYVLQEFLWHLSDTDLVGQKRTHPCDRFVAASGCAMEASMLCMGFAIFHPLVGSKSEIAADAWKFNIRRLAHQLLDQPQN